MTDKDKPRGAPRKPFDKSRKPAAPARKPVREPRAAAVPETVHHAGDELPLERISKIMARAGVASRRDCERLIMEGRVRLNGKVLDTPAVTCTLADVVEVDGVPIRGIERTRLWLYHKPLGLVTTNSDPEGRPTVFENLPEELPRVMSIGRLDINTEGLLLLTNDGGLARVLELPATGWLRRYRVRAYGKIEQADLDALRDGIAVDGVLYAGIEATLDRVQGHNVWITMGLREGKNREIKNVLGALGLDVNRLIRISYGPFQLGELGEGKVMEVRSKMLRDQLGPRLIEQAKANFDAPIMDAVKVEKDEEPLEDHDEARPARSLREKPEDRREQAWSRIENKKPEGRDRDDRGARDRGRDDRAPRSDRDRGDRGERKFGDRPAGDRDRRGATDKAGEDRPKRPPLGTIRTANIWMAPDARPLKGDTGRAARDVVSAGRKVSVAYKEKDPNAPPPAQKPKRARARPFNAEERAERKAFGDKPRGRPAEGRSRDDRGAEARPARAGESRPYDGKPRAKPSEGRSFDAKPSSGRPAAKPFGDKPRGRPAEGRSRDDRGTEARPARAGESRPYDGKPRGKPAEGRGFDGKPSGKPAGKSFGKSFGKPDGKPGGRPGGKPSSGRPGGAGKGAGRGADRRR